jgi:hypothetical protein
MRRSTPTGWLALGWPLSQPARFESRLFQVAKRCDDFRKWRHLRHARREQVTVGRLMAQPDSLERPVGRSRSNACSYRSKIATKSSGSIFVFGLCSRGCHGPAFIPIVTTDMSAVEVPGCILAANSPRVLSRVTQMGATCRAKNFTRTSAHTTERRKPNDQDENTKCCDNSFRHRCHAGVRSTDPSWPSL